MMVMEKKKKPKFNVPNLGFFKSVKARWRKPRGTHNKKRMKFKWAGALPHIGYRNPASLRGMHPGGSREVLVRNMKELEGLKDVVVRIASAVGAKKRALMAVKAKSLNLRIVNMRGMAGEAAKPWTGSHAKAGESAPKAPMKTEKAEKPAPKTQAAPVMKK